MVYLLKGKDKKPITQPTFLNNLRQITGLPEINTDIMSCSYIYYFYSGNNKTMKEQKHLSHVMRHSVMSAQHNYLKVDKINHKLNKRR